DARDAGAPVRHRIKAIAECLGIAARQAADRVEGLGFAERLRLAGAVAAGELVVALKGGAILDPVAAIDGGLKRGVGRALNRRAKAEAGINEALIATAEVRVVGGACLAGVILYRHVVGQIGRAVPPAPGA